MELETFLEGIENCPNEIVSRYAGGGRIEKEQRLCAEWGITDNYLILLKTGLRKVSRFFGEDQNYTLEKSPLLVRSVPTEFMYNPGTAIGRIEDRLQRERWSRKLGTKSEKFVIPGYLSDEEKEHFRRQGKFNITITLWPYQGGQAHPLGKRMEDTPLEKAMSLVISDIGRWALKEKIPLCIPQVGTNYHRIVHDKDEKSYTTETNPERFKRIVYFNP